MTPRFPANSTQELMRAHQRAQRGIGVWPAATLNPVVAIKSALRQLTLVTPDEAHELELIVYGVAHG